MKKVLILSLAYYPKHIGGAEMAIKEITDRIPHRDIEFHLICNRYDSTLPQIEQIGNVLVHRIGITTRDPSMADLRTWPPHLNKLLFQFLAFWKARELHREYHYDGIWAMMAHSCGVPAGLFKTLFPQVTYVLTLQEGDPPEYIERKMRILGPLFKRAFTKADVLQAISTFLADWGARRGFQGPVAVVPNAVNVQHFSHTIAPESLSAVREGLGKKEGDVFLVTTSRLVHKNGIDVVVKALSLLSPNVQFVIFGTGPDEEMLRDLAEKCGVAGRVHFRGQIDHTDMPQYLKACDIFIRPSRSEGMGNSFVEAMAAGLPVIATQEGGIADFLFDAKRNPEKPTTGWAVDVDSPASIRDAVEDIMTHPEKVAAVRKTAYEMVVSQYDWDLIARDMQEKVFSHVPTHSS